MIETRSYELDLITNLIMKVVFKIQMKSPLRYLSYENPLWDETEDEAFALHPH